MMNRGLKLKKQEMIDAMMAFFETGQEIYGVCPCCEEIFRVSEMQIFYGKKPPKDWLDDLRGRKKKLKEDTKSFELEKKKIIDKAIERSLSIRIGKTLEKIAPIIPQLGHHPSDVRGIYEPIDFIAFNGMFKKKDIDTISFIEIKTGASSLNRIQRRIRDAVNDGRVDWRMYNVTDIIDSSLNESGKKSLGLRDFMQ
jgi:predicted Holliday junction resolvase-like endonuclease